MDKENRSRVNKLAFGMFLLAVGGLIIGGVLFYGAYNEFLKTKILNDMVKEGYILTSDATATDEDIIAGKNAYVNGQMVRSMKTRCSKARQPTQTAS